MKIVISSFAAGIWIAMLTGYYNYFTLEGAEILPRIIVPDISHIRLGLMLITLIGFIAWLHPELNRRWKVIGVATFLSILPFLYILQALTAMVIVTLVAVLVGGRFIIKRSPVSIKMAGLSHFVYSSNYHFLLFTRCLQ